MKTLLAILFISFFNFLNAQDIPTLKPTIGKMLDFGPTIQKEWALRDKALEDLNEGNRSWEELTSEEQATFEKYGEVYENMWDIVGGGCSWYCGGGLDTQTASSELSAQGTNTYIANNAHDLSYETAWVEGVPGYGIGEYLEYHVKPENPRITDIIIVNGYVKSDNAWKNNSRVKTLKMYVDNKPYAVLELADTKAEQHFKVDPIGYNDRHNFEQLKKKPNFTMKFEISEVYPGAKWDDTAITEIYFNGLDVH
ncbi:NADase-type glycan-binding domain-containing protein [Marinoscillum luteum]|uniref:NADase-type glycan-binding domain-containing protein n=1 Tax=Marinoscillum luteum TaxID=861051 RepID=A0ABW7NAC6_9BACT